MWEDSTEISIENTIFLFTTNFIWISLFQEIIDCDKGRKIFLPPHGNIYSY